MNTWVNNDEYCLYNTDINFHFGLKIIQESYYEGVDRIHEAVNQPFTLCMCIPFRCEPFSFYLKETGRPL